MIDTDETLIKAALSGEIQAFGNLIERHYDRIFALSFRLMGSKADAEDLTQDVCAMLPMKLKHFEGRAKFTSWLYRLVVNKAHDLRRARARYATATQGWGDWEGNRIAVIDEDRARLQWLSTTMAELPDTLRDTLALILDGDLSHKDAAEILNVSEGTISWRISDAKKRLKVLKDQEENQ
ncbi:MAG: RNA polymerase sigma factor [Halocynthiibacter sp.]